MAWLASRAATTGSGVWAPSRATAAVAGLGGGEGVRDPFADEQHPGALAGGGGVGEAGVGGERGGRVVVLAAGHVGVEVAGLDVGDVPGDVEGGQDGGDIGPVGEAAGASHQLPAGVGAEPVGGDGGVVEARVRAASRGPGAPCGLRSTRSQACT